MKYIKSFPLELIFWITALMLLATANAHEHLFTLCPLANFGFEDWCPGCGLGRSISLILHGQLIESFNEHWFGLPALFIILYRIYRLITQTNYKILTTNR